MGVFWRLLGIEAILLVWSLFYRAYFEGGDQQELLNYALRIVALVAVILGFMILSLGRFLTRKVITPLEKISEANRSLREDDPKAGRVDLPPGTPAEMVEIAATRRRMLDTILAASQERLRLMETIRATFGRYVPEQVVEQILASPQNRQLGGRRTTVTVLMADLRGFTQMSAQRRPEEMVELLNRYLSRMSEVIMAREGIIDEIIGDGILAVFGAPETRPDDAARAVACALEMQNALAGFNQEIAGEGFPFLEMGIGINTGQVILGNIGSPRRMKYGIVGEPVNTAGRIEGNSLGGEVLVGESTWGLVAHLASAGSPRLVMMKGLPRPLRLYPVRGLGGPFQLELTPAATPAGVGLSLGITCWPLADKTVEEAALRGRTSRVGPWEIRAHLPRPLPLYSDLLLKLEPLPNGYRTGDIYAKVVGLAEPAARPRHQMRITGISAQDREALTRLQRLLEADPEEEAQKETTISS